MSATRSYRRDITILALGHQTRRTPNNLRTSKELQALAIGWTMRRYPSSADCRYEFLNGKKIALIDDWYARIPEKIMMLLRLIANLFNSELLRPQRNHRKDHWTVSISHFVKGLIDGRQRFQTTQRHCSFTIHWNASAGTTNHNRRRRTMVTMTPAPCRSPMKVWTWIAAFSLMHPVSNPPQLTKSIGDCN